VSGSFASIGGIASGLDTASIIQQLMALERRPMQAIQQRQQSYRAADQAWSQIVSKLSGLRTATDALRDPASLSGTVSVSSSNDQVATATAIGSGAQTGSVSLRVDQLAAAHQRALGGSFESPDHVLGEGTITLRNEDGSERASITLGEGATLADAARALDGVAGIQARVVRTGDDAHRLVVTSTTTGAASRFSFDTDLEAFLVEDPDAPGEQVVAGQLLRQGQDAMLSMGDLEITRSSNTIDDLVDGVSLRLTGTGDLTVHIDQDVEVASKKVKALVDGMNAVLGELSKQSASSAEAGSRGPLSSDPLVRTLAMDLRATISQTTVDDGPFRTMSDLGISLTRDGEITLDETRLTAAITEDPQAVGRLLGRTTSTSDARVQVSAPGRAEPGDYDLVLSQAATIAARTGAVYTPPNGAPKTFTVTVDGKTVSITVEEGDSAHDAVRRINDALAEQGVSRLQGRVRQNADGQEVLAIEATQAGARSTFTVDGSGAWDLDGTHEGSDAAGTLSDGTTTWELTGSGRSLTAPRDTAVHGLVLRAPLGVAGDLGTVHVEDGLAGILDRTLRAAEGSDGSIGRARKAIEGRISSTKSSLEAFERRLELRETTIRRQFTALESAMSRMHNQASWMMSQLGGMQQG
jgi:flagellar hook-associated protein 2